MNKDLETIKALNTEEMEKVSGGNELGRTKLYKYRCQRCGQKYSFSKASDVLKQCLVCGGNLEFVGITN